MHLHRYARLTGVALAGSLVLSACGTDDNPPRDGGSAAAPQADIDCPDQGGTLNAAGSSAQANAMSAWVKTFQQACDGVTVNYQASGSGAGIESFTNGQVGFAGSDSAMKEDEAAAADARCETGEALNLPMVIGPIAVAYNLDGVEDLQLSAETLAGIYSGQITEWDDPAIKKDNPGASLPSTPIQAFHRSDSSGTTDNFTKFLAAAGGDAWAYESGKEWQAPGGQGAKGSEGVASAVKDSEGAIGYMEISFAENSGLSVAKIANGSGEYVELTPESAGKTIDAAEIVGNGNDLALEIDYATDAAGAYPIVLVTYEITCEQGLDAADLDLVKSFLTYTASDGGQAILEDLGYAPLPNTVQAKVQDAVEGLS